ncbi:MAG: hypothetical protein PV362_16535, partial [Providencia heimbachae]|nr:hypothetical protein [Providencia heimbachae]
GFVPPKGNDTQGSNGASEVSKGNNTNGNGTKWPEVQPSKPVITSPGSSSSLPGFVPPKGNDTQGGNGASESSKGNNANGNGTKWPEVQPSKPVITSPGSSNSMSGFMAPSVDKTVSLVDKKWLQLHNETIIS